MLVRYKCSIASGNLGMKEKAFIPFGEISRNTIEPKFHRSFFTEGSINKDMWYFITINLQLEGSMSIVWYPLIQNIVSSRNSFMKLYFLQAGIQGNRFTGNGIIV
jgi:hypothetical protein